MSPIPTPTGEGDLGPCIRALRREGYKDNEQRIAICMSKWRKSKGIPEPKEKK